MESIKKILYFINEIEGLKSVVRTAWMKSGRQESTAEHSWRLALLAYISAKQFPELDSEKVFFMALIHDLGELYTGDKSALLYPDKAKKKTIEEEKTIKKLAQLLPENLNRQFLNTWEEYEAGETAEAIFVKALDKAETIIQHN